ncbi:WW domain-binding protein 4 [Ictalurus punctatus]|uniref:WW domain-binding protein 4 n=1 Tax=Ictalurus punctatus TaxID=7998 RepID=A0A2D0S689_ICTPU|nr:WW domain-binding protein 4 [Ictalurus punctatus]
MADYWKSQPKKFCQYCKCWIADNKPSIEFHERGKNHKQNVAAKIDEIKKTSSDKAKKVEKMSKEFAAMEEAAMKAYEDDMKRLKAEAETPVQTQRKAKKYKVEETVEPDSKNESDDWVQGTTDNGQIYYYNKTTGESQWEKPEGIQGQSESSATEKTETGSVWMEATSPEGYMYYYNTETGESTWEKPSAFSPKEGNPSGANVEHKVQFISRPESLSAKGASNSKQSQAPKISFRKRKEEVADLPRDYEKEIKLEDLQEEEEYKGNVESSAPTEKKKTPAKKIRKANPYGDWEQIQEDEDPYENVDLQLPQKESGGSTYMSSDVPPEPKTKFKERTITSLGDESLGAIFKKRKTENGKPKSLRQREKDD